MPNDPAAPARRPNILLFICDDLAWGDVGRHGNPHLRTPNLDTLHDASTRLTQYRSGPVCTPARAALFTGRYAQRTGAIDTYMGRSMMHRDEVTLAELLKAAGYRTCISGKWHLGDCYPLRAMDQGFDEALVHNGGGLGQWANWGYADAEWEGAANAGQYTDPKLMHNGELVQREGYCTDVFTCHAIDWIASQEAANAKRKKPSPWFSVVGFNAPHCPHEVPERYVEPYREMKLPEKWARLYGMVENIDENVGRALAALDEHGIADDTIVIFTSDHGPCGSAAHEGADRFNAGLRDRKGSVYDGGLRVPMFIRWPEGGLKKDHEIDRVANPVDVLPTLAAAAGIGDVAAAVDRLAEAELEDAPGDVAGRVRRPRKLDGIDLLPLLRRDVPPAKWPDRHLFVQWHRGDVPQRFRNCAVVSQRYKWCVPDDTEREQLYDITADAAEKHDLTRELPELAAEMRAAYDAWFDEVSTERGDTPEQSYAPPAIEIGTEHERPTPLTRQDWRMVAGMPDDWSDAGIGGWIVRQPRQRQHRITLTFAPPTQPATVHLAWEGGAAEAAVEPDTSAVKFDKVPLPGGRSRIDAWIDEGGKARGVRYAFLERVSR